MGILKEGVIFGAKIVVFSIATYVGVRIAVAAVDKIESTEEAVKNGDVKVDLSKLKKIFKKEKVEETAKEATTEATAAN